MRRRRRKTPSKRRVRRKGWRRYGSDWEQVLSMDLGAAGIRFVAQSEFHIREWAGSLKYRTIYVDFYLLEYRLVVEVDGSQHLDEAHAREDEYRDGQLSDRGIETLRFNCGEVSRGEAIAEIVKDVGLRHAKAASHQGGLR